MVAEAPTVAFSLELNDEQRQLQQWVHGFGLGFSDTTSILRGTFQPLGLFA